MLKKKNQVRWAAAIACMGGCLLWAMPAEANELVVTGIVLQDGDTHLVPEPILGEANNWDAPLVERNTSATAYGVQFDNVGSATLSGAQIPITAKAWGG